MGKLLDQTNQLIKSIQDSADSALLSISKFNQNYNENPYDFLKTNRDISYLKILMKEKIELGMNCLEDNDYDSK